MSASSPFWRFSLATYSKPGVSSACLELQDSAGVDVNILLFVLWAGREGRLLSDAEIKEAVARVEDWRRDVVSSLRQARRATRAPFAGFPEQEVALLRTAVKRLELEAERIQQAVLFDWRRLERLGEAAEPIVAARSNVDRYEDLLKRDFPAPARDQILAAALSE